MCSSAVVFPGLVFSVFFAILSNFEAREKSFEFPYEIGQKKHKKNWSFSGQNRFFFCVFFCPISWGNSKDFSLASKLLKIAKKKQKRPDLGTLVGGDLQLLRALGQYTSHSTYTVYMRFSST